MKCRAATRQNHAMMIAPVLLLCAGAVVLAGPVEDLCDQGRELKNAGELEASVAAYRQAIALDPASADAHYGLAWVQRKQGLDDAAAAEFGMALVLSDDPTILEEAAGALERMGRAAADTTPAAPAKPQPDPPSPPPVVSEATVAEAQRLLGTGDTFEAIRVLREVLMLDPDDAAASRLLQRAKRGRRRVYVRAAADPVFRGTANWEQRLRDRFAAAASQLSRQVEIDCVLTSVEPWDRQVDAGAGLDLVADLRAAFACGPNEIVVGFTAERREPPEGGETWRVPGYSLGIAPCFAGYTVVSEIIASRDGREWRIPEPTLRESLAHEVAHAFGAVHVSGPTLMRRAPGATARYDLHPMNAAVMRAARWIDFETRFDSLTQDELARLVEAYSELAKGAASDDGVHFYRGLALVYIDRYEEAIADFGRVLAASPNDAFTHFNIAGLYDRASRRDPLGNAARLERARAHYHITITMAKGSPLAGDAEADLTYLNGYQDARRRADQGDTSIAIGLYEDLLKLRPNDIFAHLNIAELYAAGTDADVKRARAHYRAAVAIGKPSSVADQATQALDELEAL